MFFTPIDGEAMLTLLLSIDLPEEAAMRMMKCAKDYGLVNFSHGVELFGLTYADGLYTLGDADFSKAR